MLSRPATSAGRVVTLATTTDLNVAASAVPPVAAVRASRGEGGQILFRCGVEL